MVTNKNINPKVFSKKNVAAAYWAGFLAADGNISKTNGGTYSRVRLYLGLKDVSHLEKFKKFLSSDHKIAISEKYNRCSFEFAEKSIAKDLDKNFGIVPKKSLILNFPSLPKKVLPHFIRGYFDGDGSLCEARGNHRSKIYSFVAYVVAAPEFMEQMQKLIYSAIGKYNVVKLGTHPNGINKTLCMSTKDAIKFCKWIYKNSTYETRLDRKYEIYKKVVIDNNRRKVDNGIVHAL